MPRCAFHLHTKTQQLQAIIQTVRSELNSSRQGLYTLAALPSITSSDGTQASSILTLITSEVLNN